MNSIPISGSGMIDLLICQPNPVDFESACDHWLGSGWEVRLAWGMAASGSLLPGMVEN